MPLNDITRSAVIEAIGEFDQLGRDAFLRRYGFNPARQYLLAYNGRPYDSKAIAGAAHGYLPGQQPLRPSQFSGGRDHVARLMRRLGFTIKTDETNDPAVGELLRQVTSLKVNRASGRPALYQPITLLWAAGRAHRGEARVTNWAHTEERLGALLERHGTRGERPRPDYPVAALCRAGLWELTGHADAVPPAHGDIQLRRWFADHQPDGGLPQPAYDLIRDSGDAYLGVVTAILEFFDETARRPLLRDSALFDAETAQALSPEAPPLPTGTPASPGPVNRYQLAHLTWPLLTVTAVNGTTITYKEIGDHIGIHHRPVRLALGLIQDYCIDEGLPPLTVVVVNATRKRPGQGFIAWNPENLDEAYQRVHAYPWKDLPNPYSFASSGTTPDQLADRLLAAPGDSAAVYVQVRSRGIAQSIFRQALLKTYEGKCAFCGLSVEAALQAAHIIPWGQASASERMSPANGLLLCATHHQLFDAHILTLTPAHQITCHLDRPRGWTDADRRIAADLDGQPISLPANSAHHPSAQAIRDRASHHHTPVSGTASV